MSKVLLINKDKIDEEMKLIGWMASVSYDSKSDYTKIATNCIKNNHGTPSRISRFIFEISEISRVFSHEFVRHEIGVGKVQRSQRYVNEDGFGYVIPKSLQDASVLVKVPITDLDTHEVKYVDTVLYYNDFQNIVSQMYKGFVNGGAKMEDARYVLTNATFTKIHVSFDWEGLKQFCYRRCCSRAQWEIREVACKIKEEVTKAYPFLGEQLGAPCQQLGYCPEEKGCGKMPSKDEVLEGYQNYLQLCK